MCDFLSCNLWSNLWTIRNVSSLRGDEGMYNPPGLGGITGPDNSDIMRKEAGYRASKCKSMVPK